MKKLLTVLCLIFHSSLAQAATITFDNNLAACSPDTVSEYGLSWGDQNRGKYSHCAPNLLMGDDGWTNTQSIFADAGQSFDALAFDVAGVSYVSDLDRAFFIVRGYQSGAVVAAQSVLARDMASVSRMQLSGFTNLDRIEFSMNAQIYSTAIWGGSASYDCISYGYGDSCGNVAIDNLVVANLPIPGSFGLLAATLLGGLGFGWRKRGVA